MYPKAGVNPYKGTLNTHENIIPKVPGIKGNGIHCDETECIYCLNSHYCCRTSPPRSEDGYCKDFCSIYDD